MFTYTNCPCCREQNFKEFISCKDYTVSGEIFVITECVNCGLKFTNPVPGPNEIGAYYQSENYISHSNTKKGLVSKLYHLVRNYTLKKKLSLVSKHVSRGTILDYGCGTGMFLGYCKAHDWGAVGIEPDEGARQLAKSGGLEVYQDLRALETNGGQTKYDAITLWHVLEHVFELNETLDYFHKTLSPEGSLFIAVPNYRSHDAKHYGPHWAAYDVPRHLYHFDENTLSRIMNANQFKLVETLPMKFDSYYVSLLSEKYNRGRNNYLQAFIEGFRSNLSANTSGQFSSLIYVFKKA